MEGSIIAVALDNAEYTFIFILSWVYSAPAWSHLKWSNLWVKLNRLSCKLSTNKWLTVLELFKKNPFNHFTVCKQKADDSDTYKYLKPFNFNFC